MAGRRPWLALPVALAAVLVLGADGPARRKALIEFGWDEPDTRFLRDHLSAMERTPFDGCVFHVDARPAGGKPASLTWEGWGRRAFTEEDVRSAREDLRALRPVRFTRNFLRFNVTPGDVDWFDDFTAVVANARLAASLARDGHAVGILLDTEQYQGHPFDYRSQRDTKTKSWIEYATQARRRGRDVMVAFRASFPDVVVLLTFGSSLPSRDSLRAGKPLAEVDYGLLVPFVDGMVEAADGARIVDGFELSYGYRTARAFEDGYRLMTEGVAPIVADAATYRRVVSAGFGIWLDFDWRRKGWDTADPSRNHFTPEVFESSVRAALQRSDEFVWIYSETPRWWTKAGGGEKLPAAYDGAIRRARRGLTPD